MAQESQMMDAARSSLQKASPAMHDPLLRVLELMAVSRVIEDTCVVNCCCCCPIKYAFEISKLERRTIFGYRDGKRYLNMLVSSDCLVGQRVVGARGCIQASFCSSIALVQNHAKTSHGCCRNACSTGILEGCFFLLLENDELV